MENSKSISQELADSLNSMGIREENQSKILAMMETYDDTMPAQYNFSEFDSSDADTHLHISETTDVDDNESSSDMMPPPLPRESNIVTKQDMINILSDPKYDKMIWNKGDFINFLHKSNTAKDKKKVSTKKIIEVDEASKLTEYKLIFKDLIGIKTEILYSSVIDPSEQEFKKKVISAFRADTEYQKSKNIMMKKLNKCVSVSF